MPDYRKMTSCFWLRKQLSYYILGTTKLKEHLLEGADYKVLPKNGWQKLVEWYTLEAGQEPIERTVIEHGIYTKEAKVEVYLLELKLCLFTNLDNVIVREFSKICTVGKYFTSHK